MKKKILFLMLAALAITGCSTNDNEVPQKKTTHHT